MCVSSGSTMNDASKLALNTAGADELPAFLPEGQLRKRPRFLVAGSVPKPLASMMVLGAKSSHLSAVVAYPRQRALALPPPLRRARRGPCSLPVPAPEPAEGEELEEQTRFEQR